MEDWITKTIELWEGDNVRMNPPATIVDIEKAETALNFNFPEEFKALYTVVNGFEDYEWQKHMFSFWSLDRIVEEWESNSSFIGFCDFLIMSSVIGFKRNLAGIYKNYAIAHYEDELIVQTFKEVVDMINNSAQEIY